MARRNRFPSCSRLLWPVLCLLLCSLGLLGNASGATIPVTNTNDSGAGSLRAAITTANGDSGDMINITATGTVTLLSALPALAADMTITGPGANILTVSGNNSATVGSIFAINTGVTASISGLTIANGNSNSNDQGGGGILNDGTLTVSNCTISGNSGTGSVNNEGGGITNFGTMTVSGSTFSGNTAALGGGIFNGDGNTLTVTNGTFSGNSAVAKGGGIYNLAGGTLTVTNSTISGNSGGEGGGIETNSTTTTITNSIVAGNTATAADDIDGTFTDGGGNVITPASPIALAPLANYGGPTQTFLPLPNSPAICAGNKTGAPTSDQRGFPIASTYCASGKMDSGAVQTNYTSIQFTNPDASIGGYAGAVNSAVAFPAAPIVSVTENGLNQGGVPVTLTSDATGATGLGPVPTVAGTGAAFDSIKVPEAGSFTLSATLTPGTANLTTSANLKIVSITVSPSTLAGATVNRPYSGTFSASGGTTPTYNFVETGPLPAGITFNGGTGTTATLSGTPTATGSFPISVKATDGNGFSGSQSYTLVVTSAVVATTAVPTTTLMVDQAATPFTPVTGSGGTTPLSYSIVSPSPSLPTGLMISSSTGLITGTPSAASAATTYTVTVTDVNGSSATAPFSLTVSKATPTVALTPTSGTSNVNQMVTFTAAITPNTPTAPTGTVTFYTALNGGAATQIAGCIGEMVMSSQATCKTSALMAGSNSVTAVYSGDTNFSSGTSKASTQTVSPVASSTTVISSSAGNTSMVDDSVMFTATVSPSNGSVPLSGAVAFTNNGTMISGCGAIKVNATNGQAICTTASLNVGTHAIVATYGSDSNYITSNNNVTQTVTKAMPTVTLTPPSGASSVDQLVTFTVTITPNTPIAPTGTVTFSTALNGGAAIPITGCTAVTVMSSVATCNTSALLPGSNSVTAAYSGDTNFNSGTSKASAQTVTKAMPKVALTPPSGTSSVDQLVTFTVTITPNTPIAPTGTVTFSTALNGGVATPITRCTNVTVMSSVATCNTATLLPGSNSITAVYSGDTNFSSGASNASTQTVTKAIPTVSLAPLSGASPVGQAVTFTVTITPNTPIAPTGTVTFSTALNGGAATPITGCTAVTVMSSVATCKTSTLMDGINSVTAAYSGDTNFSSGISKASTQTIQDYSLTTSTTIAGKVFVTQGYTTSSDPITPQSITVTPVSLLGYSTTANNPLNLTCEVTSVVPSGAVAPTCVPSIAHVAILPSGAQASVSFTIDAGTPASPATPGQYVFTITGTDPTTGLVRTAMPPLSVDVRSLGVPVGVPSGASTTAPIDFGLPANVTLSNPNFVCQSIIPTGVVNCTPAAAGTKLNPQEPTIQLTLNGSPSGPFTVTINTAATMAGVMNRTNIFVAGLFGVPVLALLGLVRGKRNRKTLLRFIGLVTVVFATLQVVGCGGSFKRTESTGTVPAGTYLINTQATGSDGQTYQAVIQLSVIR